MEKLNSNLEINPSWKLLQVKDLQLRTDNKLSDSGLYERQWVDKKPCLAQVR